MNRREDVMRSVPAACTILLVIVASCVIRLSARAASVGVLRGHRGASACEALPMTRLANFNRCAGVPKLINHFLGNRVAMRSRASLQITKLIRSPRKKSAVLRRITAGASRRPTARSRPRPDRPASFSLGDGSRFPIGCPTSPAALRCPRARVAALDCPVVPGSSAHPDR